MKSKTRTIVKENVPNNEMDRCKISERGVILGAPDRVNKAYLMHYTRICQIDVKITNN